jgi:hypothetical protein
MHDGVGVRRAFPRRTHHGAVQPPLR